MVTRFLAWLRHLIHRLLACLCRCIKCPFGHGSPSQPRRGKLVESVEDLIVPSSGPKGPVNPAEFSLVGEFDVDWLLDTGFARQLDNLAASPGAFKTLRVMKALSSGSGEEGIGATPTTSSGTVWPSGGAIDFSLTFNALAELTSRGLIPFVVLGFFPANVSTSPIIPPTDYANWTTLIEAFFDQLIANPRFGEAAISQWWFEVWIEPDNFSFWQGSYNDYPAVGDYFTLYKATSDAITSKGYNIRLGGPAIEGPSINPLMQQFINFLVANPTVKCDFLSFHGKGDFTEEATPDLPTVVNYADQTAQYAKPFANPGPLSGVTIINDEADMRAGFNIPYEPRMTQQFPTWLAALMITYDALSSEYSPQGFRFMMGSDNAELQLVSNSFDETRTIMTAASAWTPTPGSMLPADLLKVPVFNFYELLRLLGDQHGTFISGAEDYYPNNSDLFHAITVAATNIGSVFCVYPNSGESNPWTLDYSIIGIPWTTFNVVRFQIDGKISNSYAAAGGPPATGTFLPFPGAASGPIRIAQELSVTAAIQRNVAPLSGGKFQDAALTLQPYTTTVYWLTPYDTSLVPATPVWLDAHAEGSNIILRWTPNAEAFFYSYEVYLVNGEDITLVSPNPLRAAMWVYTNAASGNYIFGVKSVSASNTPSGTATSPMVTVV